MKQTVKVRDIQKGDVVVMSSGFTGVVGERNGTPVVRRTVLLGEVEEVFLRGEGSREVNVVGKISDYFGVSSDIVKKHRVHGFPRKPKGRA